MNESKLPGPSADEADAAWVLGEMQALALAPGAARLSVAKQMAAGALFLQARRGLAFDASLRAAAQAFATRMRPTRGGLKKITSEARAVLLFGMPADVLETLGRCSAYDLMPTIFRILGEASLREVTQARAMALGGMRGGRPPTRNKPAYSAVQKLLLVAQSGDSRAQAELNAIQDLVSPSEPRPYALGRRATNR